MPINLRSLIPGKFTPHVIAASTVIFILILGEILVASVKSEMANKRKIDSVEQIATLRAAFERELNSLLYLSSGIGSYLVVRHHNIQDKEINDILAVLYQSSHHIKNFGVAIGYRLKYVYPLKGNEKAIGMYYPDNAAQWPAIEKIVRSGKPALAGPVNLVQGGKGLIYRVPLFIKDNYWGLLSTVIDSDSLFETAFSDAVHHKIQFAIRHTGKYGASSNLIHGNPAIFDNPESVMQEINIPGDHWEIALLATVPESQRNLPAYIRIAALMLAAIFGWLIYHLAQSRRKFSQLAARLNGLYELSPLGIALTDLQGRYIEFNHAFEKICGYTRDELNRLDYWELTPREYAEQEARQLESLQNVGYYGPYEKEYIRKDKTRIPLRLNGVRLHGIDGKDYIWSIVEDISESKKIEKMKNEFVSTVSHELRTPLTSISGSLGLIVGGALGPLQPQAQGMLDIAYRNSMRLNHLINDLLDMEKLIAGKMTFNMKRHMLLPILESAIESVSPYATQYQVEFVQSGCTEQDFVQVDGIRLHQVLGNLLSNAAKFSPPGSKVLIDTQRIDGKLRVSVTDSGPGIPAEFRSRIFQKFSQADASDTRQKGGTGLGLAISKEIIERMHGSIGFESTAGRGACFHFELPAIDSGKP